VVGVTASSRDELFPATVALTAFREELFFAVAVEFTDHNLGQ